MVLVATFALVALMIAGYVWFVVWRLRVDRRKKQGQASGSPSMSAPMPMPMSAPMSDQDPVAPADATNAFLPSSAAPVAPVAPAAASIGPRTVTDLLAGIKLPNDLAPITMMAPRPDVGDRIAFVTEGVPGATVGAAFGAELERLGYTLTPLNPTLIAADRGTDQLRCMIHLDAAAAEIGKAKAFPAVPVGAVVIEVWSLF